MVEFGDTIELCWGLLNGWELARESFKIVDLQRLSSPGIMIEILKVQIYLVQTPQGKLLYTNIITCRNSARDNNNVVEIRHQFCQHKNK